MTTYGYDNKKNAGGDSCYSSGPSGETATGDEAPSSEYAQTRRNGGHSSASQRNFSRGRRRSDGMYFQIVQTKHKGDPNAYVADLESAAADSSPEVRKVLQAQIKRVKLLFNLESAAGTAGQR